MASARTALEKIKEDYGHGGKFGPKSERNLLALLDVMVCEIEDLSAEVEKLKRWREGT